VTVLPVSYDCDEKTRIMTWTVTDPLRSADWLAALDQTADDPTVVQTRPVAMIVDLRERRSLPPVDAVRAFATSIRERAARRGVSRFQVAVIVPSPASHGMVRVAEAYVSDVLDVQIFADVESARAWIRTAVEA
jgi:hypothetical protein